MQRAVPDGFGGFDGREVTTNFSPVGALGAFSPRRLRSNTHNSDDVDVIGLHYPGAGLPGYWTTAEEDALARFFLAHNLPSLADAGHCRRVVRAFQRRADLHKHAASSERSGDQTSPTPWQHDLHAALIKFALEELGESGLQDDRPSDELLQQCWGNEDAFLARTILPPPPATYLEPESLVNDRLSDALGKDTLLPPQSAASSATDASVSLDHTLLAPETDRSERDQPVKPKRWCQHVTFAKD
eukprot:COSAG02_NODE_2574_length_8500_cov_21.668254_11_plen_243_part_00